jgi:nicotinamide-nucleotide amidase
MRATSRAAREADSLGFLMGAVLVCIGTELVRGEITNTNASWLAASLTALGFVVDAVEELPDDLDAVATRLRVLGATASPIVVTGGLGPTSDDLTAAAAAKAFGLELARDESALLSIRRKLDARGKTTTPAHEKQADFPRGADVLANAVGTAPGFALSTPAGSMFFLPGVPREMKRMFDEQVVPRIRPSAPDRTHEARLCTYGLGESAVAARLADLERELPGVVLGYRAQAPEVYVKVLATADSPLAARDLSSRGATLARERLGDVVYGEGADAFPDIVARSVRARGWTLALAESCTGGLISHLLTRTPASDYLIGGAVTYANSAKTRLLGVAEDTLRGHGAVSGEVAAEMARGVRRLCETDVGLSVTGIAGPSGGTPSKPVGLVFWAVSYPGGTLVRSRLFHGDRDEIQLAAAYAALDLLRRVASNLPTDDDQPDSRRAPAPAPSQTGTLPK